MKNLTITELAISWGHDLQILNPEITFLANNRLDFEILESKYTRGTIDGFTYNFITRNYASAMSIAIRRMIDRSGNVISLLRTIEQIAANAHKITTEWFTKEWNGNDKNALYLEFFGSSPVLKKTVVKEHINKLLDITKPVKDWTNQFEVQPH